MPKYRYLIAILFLPFSLFAQYDETTLTKIGQPAPAFNFQIERNKASKLEDYKGKIVLINFFATWCPPCRLELPRVQKEIWDKYKDHPNFALLIFGREEGWDKLLAFKEANRYTFPILPDEDRKIYSLYATQYIPRNVIIDGEGKVIYQSVSYEPEEFGKMLRLLEGKLKK